MNRPKLMPPRLLVFTLLASVGAWLWLPLAMLPVPLRLLGLLPLAVGVSMAVAGSRQFRRVGTNMLPHKAPGVLVQDGVFAWSRNPMYLGFVLAALGVALLLGAASALPFPFALGLTLHRRFIPMEEAMMQAAFGERFDAYRARVRRWI